MEQKKQNEKDKMQKEGRQEWIEYWHKRERDSGK